MLSTSVCCSLGAKEWNECDQHNANANANANRNKNNNKNKNYNNGGDTALPSAPVGAQPLPPLATGEPPH